MGETPLKNNVHLQKFRMYRLTKNQWIYYRILNSRLAFANLIVMKRKKKMSRKPWFMKPIDVK